MLRALFLATLLVASVAEAGPFGADRNGYYRGEFSAVVTRSYDDGYSAPDSWAPGATVSGTFLLAAPADCQPSFSVAVDVGGAVVNSGSWASGCLMADVLDSSHDDGRHDGLNLLGLFAPNLIYLNREAWSDDQVEINSFGLSFAIAPSAVVATGDGWQWQWQHRDGGAISGSIDLYRELLSDMAIVAAGVEFALDSMTVSYHDGSSTTVPAPASALLMVPLLWWLVRRRAG